MIDHALSISISLPDSAWKYQLVYWYSAVCPLTLSLLFTPEQCLVSSSTLNSWTLQWSLIVSTSSYLQFSPAHMYTQVLSANKYTQLAPTECACTRWHVLAIQVVTWAYSRVAMAAVRGRSNAQSLQSRKSWNG